MKILIKNLSEILLAHASLRQFLRYGIVGLLSNTALYIFYLIITSFHVDPLKAMTCAYITGLSIGFLANRQWTFSYRGSLLKTFIRYLIAHSFGYSLNFIMLRIFVEQFGFPHQIVQAAAIILVAIFLFFAFKYFVFPKNMNANRGLN